MNPPYAVAGADIEVGMRVILAPGDDAFRVSEVLANAWYAEVEQS